MTRHVTHLQLLMKSFRGVLLLGCGSHVSETEHKYSERGSSNNIVVLFSSISSNSVCSICSSNKMITETLLHSLCCCCVVFKHSSQRSGGSVWEAGTGTNAGPQKESW